jgi:hypothetical protein
MRADDFDDDETIELAVPGAVHLAHSAGADGRQDLIRPETSARRKRQIARIIQAGSDSTPAGQPLRQQPMEQPMQDANHRKEEQHVDRERHVDESNRRSE